jgi:hypothetical protein
VNDIADKCFVVCFPKFVALATLGIRSSKRQSSRFAIGRLFRSPSDFLPERFLPKPLLSLLEATDLYWSSLGVDRSDITVDIVAHFVAALVRRFEWLHGIVNDTRPWREGPGIEVSELNFPLAANAKTR